MTFELWTSITRQEVDTKQLLHVLDSDASPQDADDLVRFAVALLCVFLVWSAVRQTLCGKASSSAVQGSLGTHITLVKMTEGKGGA